MAKFTIRRKTFSSKKKMSDEEFKETEGKIIKKYKEAGGHAVGSVINAGLATYLGKNALKGAGSSKTTKALAGVGAAVSAGNAGYHLYRSGKKVKEAMDITTKTPGYMEKLDKEFDEGWDGPDPKKKKDKK